MLECPIFCRKKVQIASDLAERKKKKHVSVRHGTYIYLRPGHAAAGYCLSSTYVSIYCRFETKKYVSFCCTVTYVRVAGKHQPAISFV